MKLVVDEKLKHRIIGFAVIISLGAIFAPAMMKKSSQNIEANYSVHVRLPPKPEEPNVALSDEKEVFKTIKVAKMNLPDVSSESQLPTLAKAESLQSDEQVNELGTSDEKLVEQVRFSKVASDTVKHAVRIVSAQAITKPKAPVVAKTTVVARVAKPVIQKASMTSKAKSPQRAVNVARSVIHKPAIKPELYAVQLASFAQLSNAQSLVNKLRNKGYKANFLKVAGRNGVIYKVYAGHSPKKIDAIKLKTQLATAMQLDGFVVNTGVS